jgi:hypothetical protein
MIRKLVALVAIYIMASSFTPEQAVRPDGCYKSASADLSASGKYYLRFYGDGSVIEYETPPHIKISLDKPTLAKVMHKGSANEKFPLKAGSYFIKESAIKIVLNAGGETVTYEGTITKRSFNVQRHSTRTNERVDMEFTFLKVKKWN